MGEGPGRVPYEGRWNSGIPSPHCGRSQDSQGAWLSSEEPGGSAPPAIQPSCRQHQNGGGPGLSWVGCSSFNNRTLATF